MVEISKRDIWIPTRVQAERADVAHSLLAVDFMPPPVLHGLLRRVAVGVAAGWLQPLRTLCYSLQSAAAAMRVLAQAGHVGKVGVCTYARLPACTSLQKQCTRVQPLTTGFKISCTCDTTDRYQLLNSAPLIPLSGVETCWRMQRL